MATTLFKSHNGIIRFYDGTIIAIEDQEYSHDGLTNWEKIFNPLSHISTIDGINVLDGHLYKRVKHSGDEDYQIPYRIIPDEPEFQVTDTELQWKLIGDDDWKSLLLLDSLKGEDGEDGEQGVPGEGWNIDQVGYIQTRPDCCSSLVSSSTCNTCNTNNNNLGYSTFMSIGDGTLVITTAIILAGTVTVDTVAYSHFSNNMITWTALTSATNELEARYLATDGTGAVYVDMRTTDYYSSRGMVYICADGKWTTLLNIATPSYMVKETTGSTHIGYMDTYTAPTTSALTTTIVLSNGKLEVAKQSIDETAFKQTTFGNGIEITNPMDKPKVQVNDLVGFGLRSYTSTLDSENNAQVYVQDFISDGLTFENAVTIDGEQRDLLLVNVDDIISPTTGVFTGLETSTDAGIIETDGYDNIYIKAGDALLIDIDGVNVVADELSLTADGLPAIKVFETDSNTLGIQAKHLHSNVANPLFGIEKDGLTTGSLQLRVDASSIGFNPVGQLEIPALGVEGTHLNSNTVDNTKGIEILNSMLAVKVDGTSIDFNGSGELTFAGDISSVITASTDVVIKSITANDNGVVSDTVRDDVTFRVNDGIGTIINLIGNSITDLLTLDVNVDTAWLAAQIDARISMGAVGTYWGVLEYSNSNTTTIEQFILGLNHVKLNEWYGTIQVSDGTGGLSAGLQIKSADGSTIRRIIIDNNGNLDTI